MAAKRILYIEDDPANRRLIYLMLERGGYDLLSAKSGKEGLEVAEQEIPDLILCDINLPDISGVEVCKRLKANPVLNHIPVLTLTGLSSEADRQILLDSGFDAYIAKPVNRPVLMKAIREALEATGG